MTRIHSDAARQFAERNAVVRPAMLGRAITLPGTAVSQMLSPLMRYQPPDPRYWPPITSNADHRAILREERFRARELADLPESDEPW